MRLDRYAYTLSVKDIAERVALGRHNWQACPQVVENAGTEGELRFNMLEMSGDGNIGVKEMVVPLVVGNPVVVEENETIS